MQETAVRNASLTMDATNFTNNTVPEEMVECMDTGGCSVESTNVTETDGDLEFESTTAELSLAFCK